MNDQRRGDPRSAEREARFTAWLREAAADYHRPPATPREEMWARIEGAWGRGTGVESGSAAAEPGGAAVGIGDRGPSGRGEGFPLDETGLLEAAADYHRPPATPREEMWARIEGAWRLRKAAGGTAATPEREREREVEGPDSPGSRSTARWPGWAWAAAVAAILVLGIGIGRLSVRPEGVLPGSDAGTVASLEEADGGEGVPDEAGVTETTLPTSPSSEGGAGGPFAEAGPTPGGAEPSPDGGEASARASARLAFRTTAMAHLGRTEAFLTAYRADAGRREEDRAVGLWARDLLSETRLLLDWGADRDPRLRSLLEELELVLVQIARLGPEGDGRERHIIVDEMQRQDVLSRLRTVNPAGPVMPDRTGA